MSDQVYYKINTDKERTYVKASKEWKLDEEAKLRAQGLVKVYVDLGNGRKGSTWTRPSTAIGGNNG